MMNPYILLALALAWAGSLAVTGYKAFTLGEDKCIAAGSKAEKLVAQAIDNAQKGAAEAIANNRPLNVTNIQEVRREIKTNTVYSTCVNTTAGLRGINEALTGVRPQPADTGKLPATGAAN